MTLSTTVSRVDYPGAGSVGPFPVPFRILAAADLLVVVRDAEDVETELSLTTDYAVTGIGNATAALTLATALAVGETLSILRAPSLVQPVSIQNQGTYFSKTHEDEFDRLVMQLQSLQDQIDRSFGILESYTPAGRTLRLKPETGKALVWQSPTELGNATIDSGAIAVPGEGRTVATATAYLLNNRVYNVRDFGAVGDGVANDTVAIQLAIDTATASGGIVVLPAGNYKLVTGLTINGAVRLVGAGGPASTDGAFISVAQTTLTHVGADWGITIIGSPAQGITNYHLSDFMLVGSAAGLGGIFVGSGVNTGHGSVKQVAIKSYTNGPGMRFKNALTSVFENVVVRSCQDGFKFDADANSTTLRFIDCHGYTCTRNALRVVAGASVTGISFYGFAAESSDDAGIDLDGAQNVDFHSLYCEDNNKVGGAATVIVRGTGANASRAVVFYSPYIQNPVGGLVSFSFANAALCAIYHPRVESTAAGWCVVTAATTTCAIYAPWVITPTDITGNAAGRMATMQPFNARRYNVSLANTADTALGDISGIYVFTDAISHKSAIIALNGAAHSTAILADPNNGFSVAAGTVGRVNVYWDGAGNYRIENKIGATLTLVAVVLNTGEMQ